MELNDRVFYRRYCGREKSVYYNGRREDIEVEKEYYNEEIGKMMNEGEYYNGKMVEML